MAPTELTLLSYLSGCSNLVIRKMPTQKIVDTAHHESGFDPLLSNDSTIKRSYRPATIEDAMNLVRQLVEQMHSVDAGVVPLNNGTGPL